MPKSSEKHQKVLDDFEPVSGNDLAGCLDMDLRPAQVNIFNKWWHNELLKQGRAPKGRKN